MNSPTEEIKQRIDIVDLISEYIKLLPAGANFKALCPFHNEKTPSFIVSPEKQIWHCFGCAKGGDHFSFIQNLEGIEFPEALRILAGRAGVKLEYRDPELHNQKTRLLDICRTVAEYWHNLLLEDESAGFVRDYLNNRQLNKQTIKDFLLGYAKESWDDVIKFLQDKGFTLKEITDAGISVAGEKGKPYDRFRNRLMLPIRDVHGNVIAFTSRKMSEDDKGGKYINSPQTVIYNKSQVLYNLDLAKQEIKRLGYAILVEGNTDAISSYQAGTKNVVAVSGTALTAEQIKILKRFSVNIMIAFDADVAGTKANLRGIDLAWQEGFNVKVINLPNNQDPDDIIREDVNKWKNLIKSAQNFMDYIFEVTFKELDLTRVDHKKLAAKKILPLIAKFGDQVEKSHYLKKLAEKLNVREEVLVKSLDTLESKDKKKLPKMPSETPLVSINQEKAIAEHLLALLIKFPEQLKLVTQHLKPEMIAYKPVCDIYKELIIYYNNNQSLNEKDLISGMASEKADYLNQLSLFIDKDFFEATPELINHEVIQVVNRLKSFYIKKRLKEITIKLAGAEKQGHQEEVNSLSEEFTQLTRQLQEI